MRSHNEKTTTKEESNKESNAKEATKQTGITLFLIQRTKKLIGDKTNGKKQRI